MIKHIVMFKLKDRATAPQVKAKLMELDGQVDVVREWEVGINIGASSKPYEVVVNSSFDSLEDVAVFRKHPKHVEVVAAIQPYIEVSGTVDYER